MREDWGGLPLPMRILIACVAALVLAVMVGSLFTVGATTVTPDTATTTTTTVQPAAAPTTTTLRPVPSAPTRRFSTTTAPGLTTSPQDAYETARAVCASKPAREIAADFDMDTGDPDRIVERYGRNYDRALRSAVAAGCRDGLAAYAKEHPGQRARTSTDPNEVAQQFMLGVDNDAAKLETAISGAQDGARGSRATIRALERAIALRITEYRGRGGQQPTVGARRLVDVARQAVAAVDAGDARGLVRARRAVSGARERVLSDGLARR